MGQKCGVDRCSSSGCAPRRSSARVGVRDEDDEYTISLTCLNPKASETWGIHRAIIFATDGSVLSTHPFGSRENRGVNKSFTVSYPPGSFAVALEDVMQLSVIALGKRFNVAAVEKLNADFRDGANLTAHDKKYENWAYTVVDIPTASSEFKKYSQTSLPKEEAVVLEALSIATKTRDMSFVRRAVEGAERLGLGGPKLETAKAPLLAVKALNVATNNLDVQALDVAIAEANRLGVIPVDDLTRARRARAQGIAVDGTMAAAASRDCTALRSAIEEAERLQLSDHSAVIDARAVYRDEARLALKSAVVVRDAELLIEAIAHGEVAQLEQAELDAPRALLEDVQLRPLLNV